MKNPNQSKKRFREDFTLSSKSLNITLTPTIKSRIQYTSELSIEDNAKEMKGIKKMIQMKINYF